MQQNHLGQWSHSMVQEFLLKKYTEVFLKANLLQWCAAIAQAPRLLQVGFFHIYQWLQSDAASCGLPLAFLFSMASSEIYIIHSYIYVLWHIFIHMILIYICIHTTYFFFWERKLDLLFPYSAELSEFAGQDCCIPCVRQVPDIAGPWVFSSYF